MTPKELRDAARQIFLMDDEKLLDQALQIPGGFVIFLESEDDDA